MQKTMPARLVLVEVVVARARRSAGCPRASDARNRATGSVMPASWLSGTTGVSRPADCASGRAHAPGRVDDRLGGVAALVGPDADDPVLPLDDPGRALAEAELHAQLDRAPVERGGRHHRRRRPVLGRVRAAAQPLAVDVRHERDHLVALEPADVEAVALLDLQQVLERALFLLAVGDEHVAALEPLDARRRAPPSTSRRCAATRGRGGSSPATSAWRGCRRWPPCCCPGRARRTDRRPASSRRLRRGTPPSAGRRSRRR